jgi:hypothetical protein
MNQVFALENFSRKAFSQASPRRSGMMLSMRDLWQQRLQRAEALAARGDSTSHLLAFYAALLRATWIEPSRFHHRDLWMVTTAL